MHAAGPPAAPHASSHHPCISSHARRQPHAAAAEARARTQQGIYIAATCSAPSSSPVLTELFKLMTLGVASGGARARARGGYGAPGGLPGLRRGSPCIDSVAVAVPGPPPLALPPSRQWPGLWLLCRQYGQASGSPVTHSQAGARAYCCVAGAG